MLDEVVVAYCRMLPPYFPRCSVLNATPITELHALLIQCRFPLPLGTHSASPVPWRNSLTDKNYGGSGVRNSREQTWETNGTFFLRIRMFKGNYLRPLVSWKRGKSIKKCLKNFPCSKATRQTGAQFAPHCCKQNVPMGSAHSNKNRLFCYWRSLHSSGLCCCCDRKLVTSRVGRHKCPAARQLCFLMRIVMYPLQWSLEGSHDCLQHSEPLAFHTLSIVRISKRRRRLLCRVP
jgi:hypothetical protein